MQKNQVRSLVFSLILNLIIKPVWILGIDRWAQLQLGTAEYGNYAPLLSLTMLLTVFLDPGLHTLITKSIAKESGNALKLVESTMPLKGILSALYFSVTMVSLMVLKHTERDIYLIILLLFNQIIASLTLYLRSFLSGLHLFMKDVWISVADKFLMIVFIGGWLTFNAGNFSLEIFIYLQMLSFFLTFLLAVFILHKEGLLQSINFKWDVSIINVLKSSLPYALLGLLMTLYTRLDAVMIDQFLNDNGLSNNNYISAFRLLDAASNIAYLFSVVYLPVFAKLIFNEPDKLRQSFSFATKILFIPALIVVLLSVNYADVICNWLYKEQSGEQLIRIFSYLFPVFLSFCLTYTYGALLTAAGKIRFLNYSSFIGLCINFLINLYTIPKYGAFGSVMATLCTQSAVSISQALYASYIFKLFPSLNFILRFFICFISFIGIIFIFNKFIHHNPFLEISFISILCISFALLFKIFPNSLKKLFFNLKNTDD